MLTESRLTMRGTLWIALLLMPAAVAQPPLEIDILEEYLAEHDRVPGTPHCLRHDGYIGIAPDHGEQTPLGATNGILEQHKQWHENHGLGMNTTADEADRGGEHFVAFHRAFLAEYNDWRTNNQHPPVVPWNPAEPQPPELEYQYPTRACHDQDPDARVPLPSWLTLEGGEDEDALYGYTGLCDFEDLNELGKSIRSSYHITVHQAFGEIFLQDPRDPWFWSFHQFLDDQISLFESVCMQSEVVQREAEDASAPGAAVVVGLAVAAHLRRRR